MITAIGVIAILCGGAVALTGYTREDANQLMLGFVIAGLGVLALFI